MFSLLHSIVLLLKTQNGFLPLHFTSHFHSLTGMFLLLELYKGQLICFQTELLSLSVKGKKAQENAAFKRYILHLIYKWKLLIFLIHETCFRMKIGHAVDPWGLTRERESQPPPYQFLFPSFLSACFPLPCPAPKFLSSQFIFSHSFIRHPQLPHFFHLLRLSQLAVQAVVFPPSQSIFILHFCAASWFLGNPRHHPALFVMSGHAQASPVIWEGAYPST